MILDDYVHSTMKGGGEGGGNRQEVCRMSSLKNCHAEANVSDKETRKMNAQIECGPKTHEDKAHALVPLVVRVSRTSSVLLTPCSLSLPLHFPTGRRPRRPAAASSSTMVSPSTRPLFPLPARANTCTPPHTAASQPFGKEARRQGGGWGCGREPARADRGRNRGYVVGWEGRATGSALL